MRCRHQPGVNILTMAEQKTARAVRPSYVAAAIIVTVAVSGFFMGLRQTGSAISLTRPVEVKKAADHQRTVDDEEVPGAVRYIDQDWLKNGKNQAWHTTLASFRPAPESETPPAMDEGERNALLAERGNRRAFDGAPPTIPHAIAQDSSASCIACHGEGLLVREKSASRISHATFANCTQCHVPTAAPFIGEPAAPLASNSFQGALPQKGTRAWQGAPPTVPHATLMRSDCMSCHGNRGSNPLRTPHLERQSCTQCHVPAAERDQRAFVPSPPIDQPQTR